MNTPKLVLTLTLLVGFRGLYGQCYELLGIDVNSVDLLRLKLSGCLSMANTGKIISYAGDSDSCEWLSIKPNKSEVTPIIYESEASSDELFLLVTGLTLDWEATVKSYPYLAGEEIPVSLPQEINNIQSSQVISPVLEIYAPEESLFLVYNETEAPSWRWLRANTPQPSELIDTARRFILEEGESLHVASCGFDLIASYGNQWLPGNEIDISVAALNGILKFQFLHEEPMDMDGRGKSGNDIDWWGGAASRKVTTYADIARQAPHFLTHDKRRPNGDDDDDPDKRKKPPEILKQCEASVIPPSYDSMTIKQLLQAFKPLNHEKHAEAGKIVLAAIKRFEKSHEKGNKMHAISPATMGEFLRIVDSRGFNLSAYLYTRLLACSQRQGQWR